MATTVEILQPFYENEFRQAPKDSAAWSSAQDKAKRKAKKCWLDGIDYATLGMKIIQALGLARIGTNVEQPYTGCPWMCKHCRDIND